MEPLDRRAVWPGWETVRLIGRGSYGAVYEIRRVVLGDEERAALKLVSIPQSDSDIQELRNDGYDEESITNTFDSYMKSNVEEYKLMHRLSGSANVVNSDDVSYVKHPDGIGWDILIKMELLTPLPDAVPLQPEEEQVRRIARDMAKALELCRQYNILHRDIKPANIFLSPLGDYKLGDFGVAKTAEKTSGGTKIGTYKYMAPEVYNNQPYGHQADLYSLGLVLYWLLNERRMPFVPMPPVKLTAGMEEDARNRRLWGEEIPAPAHGSRRLKQIVLRACAYDPKKRYRNAGELLEDLTALELEDRANSEKRPGDEKTVGVKPPPKTIEENPEQTRGVYRDRKPDGPTGEGSKPERWNQPIPEKNPPEEKPAEKKPTEKKPPEEKSAEEKSAEEKSAERKEERSDTGSTSETRGRGHGKLYALIGAAAALLILLLILLPKGGEGQKAAEEADRGSVTTAPEATEASENADAAPADSAPTAEELLQQGYTQSEDGLFWKLEGAILSIEGRGDMADYDHFSPAPWGEQWDEIAIVRVGSGITSVGDYAFYGCSDLMNAVLPEEVTRIGKAAFQMTKIQKIQLPASLRTVGDDAFQMSNLTELLLPEGLETIGKRAFAWTNLNAVTIPASVTEIGDGAFSACNSLKEILVEEGSRSFESVEGALYTWNEERLISFPNGREQTVYMMPANTVAVGDSALLYAGKVRTIVFNSRLETIGYGSFQGLEKLRSIELPDSVVSLDTNAFRDCTALKTVELSAGLVSIGDGAFYGCSSLETLRIPDKVEQIGINCFEDCSSLRTVTLPRSLKKIGYGIFLSCDSLTDVYYTGSKEEWASIQMDPNEKLKQVSIHYNAS